MSKINPQIAGGPSNENPNAEFMYFKAGEAIAKGLLVGFELTPADGYTVAKANITTVRAIGVAAETAADGQWFKVQIAGYCTYLTNDGTDVVAGDYLVSDANAKAVPLTTAELDPADGTDGYEFHCIGQSLEAETGTTCEKVILYRHI
jgi:hypothetical protein